VPGPLTPRAIRVIEHIAHGHPRHRIATELDITERAVYGDTHRARTHLHARNEAHLIDLAIRHHILALPPGPPAPMDRYLITTLHLVAAGHSNADIAALLFLSLDGVKWRVATIRNRLHAEDRAHAVAIGHQRGILRTDRHPARHALKETA
jgi:DNA-binding NarL/FixJ family response regulator